MATSARVPPDPGAVAAGGKAELARVLARMEAAPDAADITQLLDAAWAAPRGHVVGITGPPGVGKSSLIRSLITAWRGDGRSVAIIAIDPSSRVSGGALLGDRVRLAADPEDQGLFVRSMAARDRLGGLAELTFPAMVLMRALFDHVVVETVGVGQSETDVTGAADTVICCIQPGSGDSLQFMKAGIMEVPHIAVITKADMGTLATRARADVRGALSLAGTASGEWDTPVLLVSATSGAGVPDLVSAVDRHASFLKKNGALDAGREAQGKAWLRTAIMVRFGRMGMQVAGHLKVPAGSPFRQLAWLDERLEVVVRTPSAASEPRPE